jgi:hypothetical protein
VKKTQDIFRAIVESISNSPSYARAARSAGISKTTLWDWIGQSQRDAVGNGVVLDEFMGMQSVPLHHAMQAARRAALNDMVGNLEHRSIHGHDEAVYFQGRPMWKEDESLSALSDEDLAVFGIVDRYLRDERGHRVQLTIHHEPPVSLVLAVAAANFPKVYGGHSTIDVNHKGNLGVSVVKRSFGRVAAKVAEPEQIADQSHDVIDLDVRDAPDLGADVLEPETSADDSDSVVSPPFALEPEFMKSAAPLTPLQRDLLQRFRARPGTPERIKPVGTAEQNYDPPDDVGPGIVPPGGVRRV